MVPAAVCVVQAQEKVFELLRKLAVHSGAAMGTLEDESLHRLFRAAAGLLSPRLDAEPGALSGTPTSRAIPSPEIQAAKVRGGE